MRPPGRARARTARLLGGERVGRATASRTSARRYESRGRARARGRALPLASGCSTSVPAPLLERLARRAAGRHAARARGGGARASSLTPAPSEAAHQRPPAGPPRRPFERARAARGEAAMSDARADGPPSRRRRTWAGAARTARDAAGPARRGLLLRRARSAGSRTDDGVHRLLPEERRREMQPFLELYQRVRRDEGWRASPACRDVAPGHPHARDRGASARRASGERARPLRAGAAAPGRWRVLEVGAGCCWASARLLARGHRVAAVDVNLDPDDGLAAAASLLARRAACCPRAEAEMEALPLEPAALRPGARRGRRCTTRATWPRDAGRAAARHAHAAGCCWCSTRRSTGARPDGEAMVADRMRAHERALRLPVPRESQSSLPGAGRAAAARSPAPGWTARGPRLAGAAARGRCATCVEIARHGRRTARFPILLARRDG